MVLATAPRGGLRHDADADLAFDQPADRVEAAQLHAQPQRPADARRLVGQEALQRAGAVEPDEIVVEHLRRSRSSHAWRADGRARPPARSGRGGTDRFRARSASTVPATMPRSATPSAIRPTISSLSRSSRSTLTFGCAARNELSASGRNSVSALVLESTRIWPARPPRIGAEVLVQPLGLPQDGARVLQQRAAGLGRRHALPAARQQRDAERLLHVADAGRGGGERKVGALGAVRDAAGLDHVAKQAEIGQIEAHGMLPSRFGEG